MSCPIKKWWIFPVRYVSHRGEPILKPIVPGSSWNLRRRPGEIVGHLAEVQVLVAEGQIRPETSEEHPDKWGMKSLGFIVIQWDINGILMGY